MTSSALIGCPKCHEVLDRFDVKGVELDLCPSCGGLWLDRGELAKLNQHANRNELKALDQPATGTRRTPPSSAKVKLKCPACDGHLAAKSIGLVDIDLCAGCGGLWLDRGELGPALAALTVSADREVKDAIIGWGREHQ